MLERNTTERNIQVKPASGISVDQYQPPISRKKDLKQEELLEAITEMKQAIEWYMKNTTVVNPSRSYHETFHDLGMNLRMRAEEIIETK